MKRVVMIAAATCALGACDSKSSSSGNDPRQRGLKTEAELYLKSLEKAAKAYYVEHAQFPIGVAPLSPAAACCGSQRPDHKCEPELAQWDAEVWSALDFSVDEPHFFQYAYESRDGTSFTARAVGDLDCDGTPMEMVLTGSSTGGNPSFDLVKPPRPE